MDLFAIIILALLTLPKRKTVSEINFKKQFVKSKYFQPILL